MTEPAFGDLLSANHAYAQRFDLGDLAGVADAGVAIVTCMDSRIDPLAMVGLRIGDATVLRNPGGRVTEQTLVALVVAVTLLRVRRVLVVPHTRCAMASASEDELRRRIGAAAGQDASRLELGAVADQEAALREDVAKVRTHPLIGDHVQVGGFRYDVDTGLLEPLG